MKLLNLILMRGIAAVILGLIFIIWPQSSVDTLIVIIGACLVVAGILIAINYFLLRKEAEGSLIITLIFGIVNLIFGILFIAMPYFFVTVFMYIFAVLLILAGLNQFLTLHSIRRSEGISGWYYIIPVLVLIIGIIVFINPNGIASFIFIMLGITLLLYGVEDIFSWNKFRKLQR